MFNENNAEGNENSLFVSTPEERTVQFNLLLEELDDRPKDMAVRLSGLGDYRALPTILRSIQRMSAGDIAVSAEMLVIVQILVNQQRLRDRKERSVQWVEQPNQELTATIDGFLVRLSPKTKNRWHIELVFIQTKYSPAWRPWTIGLDAAKRKALACVSDGLLEVTNLEAGRL